LYGGANNDLYHFARGDGIDLLTDTGGIDVLQFNGVSDISELFFQHTGTNLWAGFKNSADSLTIRDFYLEDGRINMVGGIDSFKLGYYGATLSASTVNALVSSTALSGSLSGSSSATSLSGVPG
jgi:hypothetical protein